jgi:hypothetical protein
MYKLRLLMSAGTLVGMLAGTAHAARVMDMTGNTETVTGTGLVTEPDGFLQMGSPYSGGQGLETETAVPFSSPQPGAVNMRINLEVNEFPMATWWTGMNGNGTATPGNKQQPYGIAGYIRLDFGLDGMTKNGIRYGGFTEIRENNTTNITGSSTAVTTTTGTGTLTGVSSGFAQSASADAADNTLFVRQANVYAGTDNVGFVRIGTGIGAQTLYEVGLLDDFDWGGWNQFDGGINAPTNVEPIWPWADDGAEYMAARVMYVSPVIDGFDFGVSFAPNNSTPFDGSGCSSAFGGVGCATQSSSTLSGDFTNRYRNEVGLALRYRNNFGPVGVAVSGIYTTSGQVNDAAAASQPYKGLNIGDVGAAIQLNKQIEIAGNVMWGAFNGSWGLQPVGGATAVAWVAGAKYTIPQVPMTLGAYYFNYKNQGQPDLPTQRTEQGLDVGAVYGLGPGVVLLAEYAWGQRYQGDYNFLTGAFGGQAGANLDNKVQVQLLTAGVSVRF